MACSNRFRPPAERRAAMSKHPAPPPHSEGTEALLTCEVCRQQIPPDEAISEEAIDYVLHLCGPACYAEWQARRAESTARGPKDD
jgi:hypothetical protein